jgi:hypothetical protein
MDNGVGVKIYPGLGRKVRVFNVLLRHLHSIKADTPRYNVMLVIVHNYYNIFFRLPRILRWADYG